MLYEVEYSVETAVSAEDIDEAKEKVVKNLNAIVQEGDFYIRKISVDIREA